MQLPIEINKESGIPIYIQLEEQIRILVHQGVLKPGDPIPTVRALSVALGINANTVSRVYRDLQQEGILKLRRGLGTFVAKGEITCPIEKKDMQEIEQKIQELITLSKKLGMKPIELFQLLEMHWKD